VVAAGAVPDRGRAWHRGEPGAADRNPGIGLLSLRPRSHHFQSGSGPLYPPDSLVRARQPRAWRSSLVDSAHRLGAFHAGRSAVGYLLSSQSPSSHRATPWDGHARALPASGVGGSRYGPGGDSLWHCQVAILRGWRGVGAFRLRGVAVDERCAPALGGMDSLADLGFHQLGSSRCSSRSGKAVQTPRCCLVGLGQRRCRAGRGCLCRHDGPHGWARPGLGVAIRQLAEGHLP